jgi:hypothetical protein
MKRLVLILTAFWALALFAGCEDDPTDRDYLKDAGPDAASED